MPKDSLHGLENWKISNYSAEEAKAELVESLKSEAKTRAQAHIQNIMEEAGAKVEIK